MSYNHHWTICMQLIPCRNGKIGEYYSQYYAVYFRYFLILLLFEHSQFLLISHVSLFLITQFVFEVSCYVENEYIAHTFISCFIVLSKQHSQKAP